MKTSQEPAIAEHLKSLGACGQARQWVRDFDDPQTAWNACERGDWMLWLLGILSGSVGSESRKAVVLAACECSRTSLALFESNHPNDKRPRTAIEKAEGHCELNVTVSEVKKAAYAAAASSAAHAAAYAAAAAASSAAHAAAYAAAAAASSAASAAYAAASAAAYATDADDDARKNRLKECADIVRKHFPKAPTIPGGER